ncbi:MAG: DNA alkylation repair protein [Devosia nanyangense]|uniref:DNA alkylation repair protein n=1 Tax=Devosia nanyangense TaxID=1228055 RepID=A0A933KXQ5_9HYPH|nr:DNA alkylation repair protein [Devosia nanyangense]
MPARKTEAHAASTARAFTARLLALQSDEELRKIQRYFKSGEGQYGEGDRFIGVRMGSIFDLAKEFVDLPPADIETLLDSDIHELRVGALSVMAKQFGVKTTPEARRKELYDLYLRRHDRINNWDLVDLAAWHVVGPWLVDKPRAILRRLARSKNLWERRTAILATFAFIKRGEFEDTLAIAKLLLDDGEDLIHKAVGGMLRAIGGKNRATLTGFLDAHAAAMPRTMLRYATEHFTPAERKPYLQRSP